MDHYDLPMPLTSTLQTMVVRELESFIKEIEAFPDDASVWALAPGVTNSAGTLALHVCGNLRHFIGAVLTNSGYVRNREREFSHRGSSRSEVVAELRAAIEAMSQAFPKVTAAQLDTDYPQPPGGHTINTERFLVHLVAHLAFHLGQAGYLRRIVTESNVSINPLPLGALVG